MLVSDKIYRWSLLRFKKRRLTFLRSTRQKVEDDVRGGDAARAPIAPRARRDRGRHAKIRAPKCAPPPAASDGARRRGGWTPLPRQGLAPEQERC